MAESVQAAMSNIQELEAKLLAQTASGSTDESRKLAELIADIDNQLTRAVAAVSSMRSESQAARGSGIARQSNDYFDGMNAIARWFARPLLTFVTEQRRTNEQSRKKTLSKD